MQSQCKAHALVQLALTFYFRIMDEEHTARPAPIIATCCGFEVLILTGEELAGQNIRLSFIESESLV